MSSVSGGDVEGSESIVLHFVAPVILAELLHLSLASRVTFDESKVVSGGAYGDISKGSCSIGGRGRVQVAIKRLRFYMKEDIKLLFEKEIYVWSKLRHENILPLLGFAVDDATGYPLLVSEWMNNGSAWTYVNSHRDCDLRRLVTGIASGLAYLHGNGIVHSDIKSDNILVSDSGNALICDFGCSRMVIASRSMANISSGIKGSLRYIAYELLAIPGEMQIGPTRHTPQTDVWAFGMTIYELFTLQRPYTGLLDIQVISAIIMRHLPSFPPLVSFDLHLQNVLTGICLACWSHNPEKRPDMTYILSLLQSRQEQVDNDGSPSPTSAEGPMEVVVSPSILTSLEGKLSIPLEIDLEHNIDPELDTPTNQNYAIFDPTQNQVPHTQDTSSPSFDTPYIYEVEHDLQASDKMEALMRALETPSPDLSFSRNVYSAYAPGLPGPSALASSSSDTLPLNLNLQFKPSSEPLTSSPLSNDPIYASDLSDAKRSLSVGIMGDGSVGKTALVRRFLEGVFLDDFDPTIEEEYRCGFAVDGERIQLDIMDTSGLEEYSMLNESQIQWGTAFILVFSLTCRFSFHKVEELRNQIYQKKGDSKVPIVVVACKSDLTEQCELDPEQIGMTVEEWGLPFYKTSAKNDVNVVDVFEGLVRLDKNIRYRHSNSELTLLTPSKRSPQCIIM